MGQLWSFHWNLTTVKQAPTESLFTSAVQLGFGVWAWGRNVGWAKSQNPRELGKEHWTRTQEIAAFVEVLLLLIGSLPGSWGHVGLRSHRSWSGGGVSEGKGRGHPCNATKGPSSAHSSFQTLTETNRARSCHSLNIPPFNSVKRRSCFEAQWHIKERSLHIYFLVFLVDTRTVRLDKWQHRKGANRAATSLRLQPHQVKGPLLLERRALRVGESGDFVQALAKEVKCCL